MLLERTIGTPCQHQLGANDENGDDALHRLDAELDRIELSAT